MTGAGREGEESGFLGSKRKVLIKTGFTVEQGFEKQKVVGLGEKMQGAGGEGCEGGKVYFPKNTRKVFMLHAQE